MKTLEIKLYSARELKEQFPEGYERALKKWRDLQAADPSPPWQDETIDSCKGCIEAVGLKLKEWSIGAYSRSTQCRVEFGWEYGDEIGELTGKRAWAWLENHLLGPLRISWVSDRNENRKHNAAYRNSGDCRPYSPGLVPPCPFTGYCADEDMIDSLKDSIKSGMTLKRAFEALADTARECLERDAEDQQREELFLADDEEQFTEDGGRQ